VPRALRCGRELFLLGQGVRVGVLGVQVSGIGFEAQILGVRVQGCLCSDHILDFKQVFHFLP
jgi:hypothetical protein